MSGFVAESRWRHLGLGSALRERGGKQYKGTQRTRKAVHGECSVELAKWTFPIMGIFAYPPSCRAPHEGGHAESQIMPSYSLVPLCCSMPSTGCFSPSSA